MRKLTRISISLVVFTFFCITTVVTAQSDLDKKLIKGKYKVGFYSTVQFDYSQNYPFYLDSTAKIQKAPKPLLINVWYPAQVAAGAMPMLRKGYMDFESEDLKITKWLGKFKKYTEDAIITEIFHKEKKELDSAESVLLDSFLLASTSVIKNANPIKQKFPFVIYAQGSGGSIEDNSVFCELLASHGYVVIGSSFQYNEDDYFGPSGPPRSVRDIVFLLSYARSLPNVNYNKAGMVGHSLGAQKMLHFMAQGQTPFDALVSLETTQEYHTYRNTLWDYFVSDVQRGSFGMQGSFLFATDATALHVLADQMRNAERYYLLTPSIAHNDYISQGIQRKYMLMQKNYTDSIAKVYYSVRDNYATVCSNMVLFLNARLKNDSSKWNNVVVHTKTELGTGFNIEQMPVGQFKVSYNPATALIPTPRQLKFMIMDGHIDSATQLLQKFWQKKSTHPIYDAGFAYAMIDYLIGTDTAQALQLYQAYAQLINKEKIDDKFISWTKYYTMSLKTKEAEASRSALYILNPDDKERIRQLIEKSVKK